MERPRISAPSGGASGVGLGSISAAARGGSLSPTRGGGAGASAVARGAASSSGASSAARAPKPLPEVHILGEIVGGTGFGDKSVCCKWSFESGDKWEWLGGHRGGQTHTVSSDSGSDFALWSHPLDVHFVAGTTTGWPRLQVQVWQQDAFGRLDLLGYGFVHVPAATGMHDVECPVWRPVGAPNQEVAAFFLGAAPVLKSPSVVYAAASERYKLVTTGAGTVHARFEIVFRNMEAYGVEW